MVGDFPGQVKQARLPAELEQAVKVELLRRRARKVQLVAGDKKWGVFAKGGCFDFKKALAPVRLRTCLRYSEA